MLDEHVILLKSSAWLDTILYWENDIWCFCVRWTSYLGCRLFFCNHHVATHHTTVHLCINTVILAAKHSATILWVLWHKNDSPVFFFFCFGLFFVFCCCNCVSTPAASLMIKMSKYQVYCFVVVVVIYLFIHSFIHLYIYIFS